MEYDRFVSPREHHKSLGFLPERGSSSTITSSVNRNKTMPNDLVQKPPPSILDRFRALLKEREEELRVSFDDDVPPPRTDEIVQMYELVLSELNVNSKPIITDLTIIAGEQREHGEGIADAICCRILEVPVEQKLPSLYLLDSIVKNIGREYVRHFSSRLPEVFCEAYRQVHPNMHPAMRHLFGTWSTVFPPLVLQNIEAQLQFSSPSHHQSSSLTPLRASESPRPTHGIHINPKYLEARRQLQRSAVDGNIQHATKTSSNSQMFGQKPTTSFEDSEYPEVTPSNVGAQRLSSSIGGAVRPSFAFGHEKLPSSNIRPSSIIGPRSIRSLSPPIDEFPADKSPSNQLSRVVNSAYSHSNGGHLQGPRALIDAYGNDRSNQTTKEKPLKVEQLNINGLNSKMATKTWQNTEEEEYVWEDMSPTLADRSGSNNHFGSDSPAMNKIPGFSSQPTQVLGSRYLQEAYNLPRHLHQSLPDNLNLRGRGGNIQIPLSPSGIASANERMPPLIDKYPDTNSQILGPLQFASKMNSSNLDSSNGVWPKSNPPPLLPTVPQQNQIRSRFDTLNYSNTVMKQGPNRPFYLPDPQSDNSKSLPLLAHQQNQTPVPPQPQLFAPHGYNPQGRGAVMSTALLNPLPGLNPSLPLQNMPNSSSNFQGGALPALPPLPPGPPPATSQMLPISQNTAPVISTQPTGAFSGLINSLMAQGFISLAKPASTQDAVGVDFDPDLLKIRHESVITALYGDLPRQCTTCGLRFKCQEEHSTHMDWHVTKNRISKNRKQKPSRKWFVSTTMWLSTAESLGADSVPGFKPTEAVVENKDDDEELAVPADENQNACALCGEHFDDFYSDENEEWMYRGAVYMNAPRGSSAGVDRSQLGPIVHAKCRSESSSILPEDFRNYEAGNTDEDSQRKRMRY